MASFFIVLIFTHLSLQLNAFSLTASQLCGFEQKCPENSSNLEHENKPCCQRCECTDVCKEKDMCCSDIESGTGADNITKQECISASYTPNDSYSSGSAQTYFVRVRCPKTFHDVKIKEKCEGGIPETFDDVIFVSSEDGTVVYKNRFCGLCHGEQNPIPWETMITLQCWNKIVIEENRLSSSAAVGTLLKRCKLFFGRPDIIPIAPIVCFKDKGGSQTVFNKCNTTGKWETYDSRLVDHCHNPSRSFYYFLELAPKEFIVYRNVYCYLCNGYSDITPKTCQLENLDVPGKSGSIVALLDTNWLYTESHKSPKANKGSEDETCEEGMIFDTFLGVCKKVYCPMPTVPVDGECIQFLEGRYNYMVDIQLVPEEEIDILENVNTDNVTYMFNFIPKLLKLDKCNLCRGGIFLSRDHTVGAVQDMYLKLALTPTPECKRDHILAVVAMYETTEFTAKIKFGQKVVRLVGKARESWKWEKKQWESIHTTNTWCATVASDRRSNCPKIKLTTDEYHTVLHNHTKTGKLLFLSNPGDVQGTVYVCLDNYLENPRGVGVVERISFGTIIATFSAIIFVF